MSEDGALQSDVRPREVWAWAMYDFANSGYTTVVITAVFNAYFVGIVCAGKSWGTLAWTLALSASYALIIFSAPILGAYADTHAAKKKLLAVTTAGCVLGTALLALVGPGDLALAVALIIVSNVFFGTGENIAAAFLPELARGDAMGKVSAWGWSLGYIGGLTTLGACLAYVIWARSHGYTEAQFVPVTMVITAAVFALASAPTFLLLKERARPQQADKGVALRALSRVGETLRHAAQFKDLLRFLGCIVLYQSGVQTVIALAAVYAQEAMGFTTQDTIVLVLLVNITASVGAFLFGQWQDRLGHRKTLALTLLGWCAMVLIAYVSTTRIGFWVAANIAGLCLGSSQSAGRALVGYLTPADRHAEFFGLWGLAVKLASILGPLTYGAVTWLTHNDHRSAMLITGMFFVLGLAVLKSIDPERGRHAAVAS
ncbi:MAG TPA: MFS transporter [Gammaproteobacteria bacterium]|nr:MFS transporter [Gammaproteobacteria bacterium]